MAVREEMTPGLLEVTVVISISEKRIPVTVSIKLYRLRLIDK